MMPQQQPFDWRTAIKSWDAASAQRKAQQPKKTQNMEMILAATKTLKILDGRITQHINALNTVWQKHRMTPNSQDIMAAVMTLQADLTKLYKTREALQKHKLAVADNVVKFDSVLSAAAWKEEEHNRDHGKFAEKEGSDSTDKNDDEDKKASLPKPTHMIETDGVTYQYHDLNDTESIKQAIPEIDDESIKDMLPLKYPRTAKIGNVDNPDTYHKPGNIPFEILKDPEDTYAESMRAPDYKGSTSTFKNGKLITIPNESAVSFDYGKAIFRKVWNHHALDIPDTVTGIYIGGFEETENKRMGAYAHVEKTLHFHPLVIGNASDDDEELERRAGQTIHHEIAHVEWFNYPKGTQKTLEDKFSSIEPANPYVKTYHEKWQTTQKKHSDIIARFGDVSTYDPESKKGMNKLTKRLKWRKNLYANEQHSALLAHMRTGHLPTDKSELDTYNKLLKSFKDVMGDKAQ